METLYSRPTYNPPYDSPIEDEFALNVVKYLDDTAVLHAQVPINTRAGRLRSDFVIEKGPLRVAVECDGKEFHDAYNDQWRDALILGTGRIDAIYRLRGKDIKKHVDDALFIIQDAYPKLFSERGLINLRNLRSDALRETLQRNSEYYPETSVVEYPPDETNEDTFEKGPTECCVRTSHRLRTNFKTPSWWRLFAWTLRYDKFRNFDHLMERLKAWSDAVNKGFVPPLLNCTSCKNTAYLGRIAIWNGQVVCSDCYSSEVWAGHEWPMIRRVPGTV